MLPTWMGLLPTCWTMAATWALYQASTATLPGPAMDVSAIARSAARSASPAWLLEHAPLSA
eukprot:6837831-Heterocapsa_arctica.AAC.1